MINGASFGEFREAAMSALADLSMDVAGEASAGVVIVTDDAIATAAQPSEIGALLSAATALETKPEPGMPLAQPNAARFGLSEPNVTMSEHEPVVAEPLETLPIAKTPIGAPVTSLAQSIAERASAAKPANAATAGESARPAHEIDTGDRGASILVAGFDRNGPMTIRDDKRTTRDDPRLRASRATELDDDLARDPRHGSASEGTLAIRSRRSHGVILRRSLDERFDYVDSEGRPWVVVASSADVEAFADLPDYFGARFLAADTGAVVAEVR